MFGSNILNPEPSLKSGVQDQEYYRALWKRILGGKVHRAMVVNRKKNGDLFYAEQTITPIQDSAGQITQFVSVIKDMTERRKLEAQKIEMELAGKVQRKLYPQMPPRLSGVDLAGAVFPAGHGCGDYSDFVDMAGGSCGIAIGDVAGHGLGPALMMAEARAYLRSIARTRRDPCEVLNEINAALARDMADNLYITLLLARLDAPPYRLVCGSAGHVSGYVLDGKGRVRSVLKSIGPPLGMFEKTVYRGSQEIDLTPGEIAFLLTDGLVESEGPGEEEFGAERALEVVRRHRHDSAQEIIRHLHRAARRFSGHVEQRDDITLVVCKLDSAPVADRHPRAILPRRH
ncbi:MAG: SpoIIE family protein phosphatase [Acidobacteriia bacterium]|nr:SpoIIE family protein phosphatase [Terriglobia bacterium]